MMVTEILAEGKGESARYRMREAEVENYEPMNRNGI
jgi:hypothetical protein